MTRLYICPPAYWTYMQSESESCSVVPNSLQPHGLHSPWTSPGQNTRMGSHSLLQGIFPTQGSSPCICRVHHVKCQAGWITSWNKTARRNINNHRYADDTTQIAESEEELKGLLIKVKEVSEKAGLKLNIQKTKIIASGSITLWQIEGEKVEVLTYFIFLGSKILQSVTAAK